MSNVDTNINKPAQAASIPYRGSAVAATDVQGAIDTVAASAGGGSALTTKGDVLGYSTVPARIPVGSDNQVLTADSSQALGVKWGAGGGNTLTTKGDVFGYSTGNARIPVGSDGQVLQADSTQALGVKWATPANFTSSTAGDVPASGGGVTNFLRADGTWAAAGGGSSPLTTKGDLYGHSTVDARIPVGTDGQFLQADSTQALGLKWASGSYVPPVTTKGDVFGYSTVPARIPVGTDGQVLTADSTQTLGLKWAGISVTGATTVALLANLRSLAIPAPPASCIMNGRVAIDDGGEGLFRWSPNNESANVANDPTYGVFVPPNADSTGASGCWVRIYSGPVNAKWFGARGNNSNDDTTAIQAAIDFVYAQDLKVVYMPSGKYVTSSPIFLDPPGNLRTNVNVPTIFNFSLGLIGESGLSGSSNAEGTYIQPNANSFVGLWVGPGNGMLVKYINVNTSGGSIGYSAGWPTTGCGIAISGGSGGASRTLLEECGVFNYYTGVCSGFNIDQLCDSVTLKKCTIGNCYIGWNVKQTQNYINSAYDCNINCVYGIYSVVGKPVNVQGGNYSYVSSHFRKKFTIGTVTSFGGGGHNIQVQATITNPDGFIDDTHAVGGPYNSFMIKTTNFGVVPLTITSFNTSTKVGVWTCYTGWIRQQYGFHISNAEISNATDLTTELAAATAMYAAQMITTWFGSVNVNNVHVENPGPTTLLNQDGGFSGDSVANLRRVIIDSEPTCRQTVDGDAMADFYATQTFPFIRIGSGSGPRAVIEDCCIQFGGNSSQDNLVIEVPAGTADRLIVRNTDLHCPNIYVVVQDGSPFSTDGQITLSSTGNAYSPIRGAGEWDRTLFVQPALTGSLNSSPVDGGPGWSIPYGNTYRTVGRNRCNFLGWAPAPWETPRLTAADITTLTGALPAIGTYPPLSGETTYSVMDWNSGTLATIWARSAHQFFSHGQNITSNSWSCKGQSACINVTDTTPFFAGLAFTITTDTANQYICTGVYPTLGYITAARTVDNSHALGWATTGTKTTVYTGTTFTQAPYAITLYGGGSTAPQYSFKAAAVNMNVGATDTTIAIVIPQGYTRYRVKEMIVAHASTAINAATQVTYGLFTAAAGGGTAIISLTASTISATADATANNMHALAPTTDCSYTATTLYIRVGTAHGSAATADVTIYIEPLS